MLILLIMTKKYFHRNISIANRILPFCLFPIFAFLQLFVAIEIDERTQKHIRQHRQHFRNQKIQTLSFRQSPFVSKNLQFTRSATKLICLFYGQ